jgi:hypothetical protein
MTRIELQLNQLLNRRIHVSRLRVDQTHNAKRLTTLLLALVCRNLSVLHPIVDRSASVTANVPIIWLVSIKNAKTLAPELADKTQNVGSSVTHPIAFASLVTPAIHSKDAS